MTFTVKHLFEHYAVGVHSDLGWISRGELRAINVGRRLGSKKTRWRITVEALAAFERLRRRTPPQPTKRRCKQSADVSAFYT